MIDLAYPGVLPVLNKRAVDFGMKAAMALNCEIAAVMNLTENITSIQIIRKLTKFLKMIVQLVKMVGLKLKSMVKRKKFELTRSS